MFFQIVYDRGGYFAQLIVLGRNDTYQGFCIWGRATWAFKAGFVDYLGHVLSQSFYSHPEGQRFKSSSRNQSFLLLYI